MIRLCFRPITGIASGAVPRINMGTTCAHVDMGTV
jgi:hypothetical protein